MALRFSCTECGHEIAVKFLKPGECALCRACGAKVPVPSDAGRVDDDSVAVKYYPEAAAVAEEREQEERYSIPKMRKQLRTRGVVLCGIGVLHLLSPQTPIAGLVLVGVGLLNFLRPDAGLFLVDGILILLVGLLNLWAAASLGFGIWLLFGALQIAFGIGEIRSFVKYSQVEAMAAEPQSGPAPTEQRETSN